MATTRSASRKAKRRADSIDGHPPQVSVSAPSVSGVRPAKKRKLEEADALALDTGPLIASPRAHSRTKRRSDELARRRQKVRLLRQASTRVHIQPDRPKSPSPVALPTPSSFQEEDIEEDDPSAKGEANDELAKLRAELAAKDMIIGSYVKSLQTLQNLAQCQVCLDPMLKPYALVPCGHTSCLTCLQTWFKAPPPEGGPDIPISRRKKTCPQCRSIVTQRPVGVFLIRDFANHVETMLSAHEGRPPAVPQQESNAAADPWEEIFPTFTNRTADGAIIDDEDGGLRRCPVCTWEILGGMCEGCGMEFDESDGEFDEDDEQFLMPPLIARGGWRRHLLDPTLYPLYEPFYAGIENEDEYDTPAEYDMEEDEYEGSFINDREPEEGSQYGTPGLETYEDAQPEHLHSPSQHSDYSDHPHQNRRQSIELTDEPSYLGPNTGAEHCIDISDSEDDRPMCLHASQRNHGLVVSSDDGDEPSTRGDYEDSAHYGSD